MDTVTSNAAMPLATVPDLPMHELLALEAVCRLGSVQAAAEALHVTPSGISHRISSLEQRIGSPLLRRRGRGVVLTDVAQSYVAAISPGLAAFAAATQALLDREHRRVRIATAAAIGMAWLLPRLQRYAQLHPQVRFELLTVTTADELPPDQWDLLIHYGSSARRGALRGTLFQEKLIQVCAPGLANQNPAHAGTPAEPRQRLATLRLTQLDIAGAASGRRNTRDEAHAQLVFDDALAMLEAASAGAGVAWSTETAARPYLAQGRLARASEDVRDGLRYAADLSEAGQLKPLATACHAWLIEHAGEH
jgi:DNA-binding transcriptional LysR family regulator